MLLTSRGKSLLFTLLAYIEGAGVIVVIILYRALIKDLVGWICEYGVNYIE
jgi:choline dehydrogenase-like flavoprotein